MRMDLQFMCGAVRIAQRKVGETAEKEMLRDGTQEDEVEGGPVPLKRGIEPGVGPFGCRMKLMKKGLNWLVAGENIFRSGALFRGRHRFRGGFGAVEIGPGVVLKAADAFVRGGSGPRVMGVGEPL